jgi:uncharacterized protein (TIGR03663 family)
VTPSRVLVLVALAGTLARLVALGERAFYYDEAWFGYWTLRALENGAWAYRPILHGPFFARVNAPVFSTLGATDASGRLVVALLGGFLPLAALLFRSRLRDGETVALGLLLAFTPTLLYYSRFMRKDLPLAAFMLLALGFAVRAADTGQARHVYAGALSLGLAFTTKESVLLWLLAWLGAAVLVLDRRLLTAEEPRALLRAVAGRLGRGTRAWALHLVGAALVFLAVVVYFYAPRGGPETATGPGLWTALGGQWGALPDVIGAATLGSFGKAIDYWVAGGLQGHPYLPYLGDTLRTMAAGALAVSVLAVVGFLADRYAGPRPLVEFNAYVGGAAVVGYPLANFLPVPWSTVHAVVPLSVPAAVGAAGLVRWARRDPDPGRWPLSSGSALGRLRARLPPPERPRPDGGVGLLPSRPRLARFARVAVAALLLSGLAVNAGATAVETSYLDSDRNAELVDGHELVYGAQAPNALREPVRAIRAAAADGSGPDVLYVGRSLAMNESAAERPPPPGAWYARMPLPWYTEAAGAEVASVNTSEGLADVEPPPVVITTVARYEAVGERLDRRYSRTLYPLDGIGDRTVVVFTR